MAPKNQGSTSRLMFRGGLVLAVSGAVAVGVTACVGDDPSSDGTTVSDGGADATGDAIAPVNDASISDGGNDGAVCSPACTGQTCFEGVCGGNAIVDVAEGLNESCVVLASGSVWCWGADEYGQLGVSPTSLPIIGTCANACRPTPAEVPGLSNIVQVSIGLHVCALDKGGDLYCWGLNQHGELGHAAGQSGDVSCGASTACNPTPSKVAGLADVVKVVAGADTTCALTKAGKLYCWGEDDALELGQGNTSEMDLSAPALVKSLPSDIIDFDIAVFAPQVCAISLAQGVWCWGLNNAGQLGHTPGGTDTPLAIGYSSSVPEQITGTLNGATQVATASFATCVSTDAGTVSCFGEDSYGGMGNGVIAATNFGLTASQATSVARLSGRSDPLQTFCTLTTDSHVACWGFSDRGELGNGVDQSAADAGLPCGIGHCASVPQQIALPLLTKLSFGGEAALGLGQDGKVYAWGSNFNGELGHVPGVDGGDVANCDAPDTTVPCNSTPHVVPGLP